MNENIARLKLHSAVKHENIMEIKALVVTIANMDTLDGKGFTPLHYATLMAKKAVIKILMENGAKTEVRNRKGQTALHMAAARGHCGIVGYLIKHGAIVDAVDNDSHTPLMLASRKGNWDVLELLLQAKKSLVEQLNVNHQTALSLALLSKSKPERILKTVHVLLRYDADIHAVDVNGWTPLLLAIFHNWTEIVKFFIKWNLSFTPCKSSNPRDKTILSPWIAALSFARLEICKVMYDGECHMDDFRNVVNDPDLWDKYPQLALFPAVRKWVAEVRAEGVKENSLQDLCREVIRTAMGTGVPDKAQHCGLPRGVQKFIVG